MIPTPTPTPVVVVTPTPVPPPTPVPTPTAVPAASPATIPTKRAFDLAINVAGSVYYSTERTFANLALHAGSWSDPSAGWGKMAAEKLSAVGNPASSGVLHLNVPQTVWSGVATAVTCTWEGSGTIRLDGDVRSGATNKRVSFTWPGFDRVKNPTGRPDILFYLTDANTSDPFRNLDCREPGLEVVGQFDKRAVDDLKPYGVLRYLDWSNANGNPAAVTWDTRTTPGWLSPTGWDGVPLEQMIDLANAAGSDAWFTVPYNADETYVRNMGKLIHDRLAPGHRAYIELSNEVWNFSFPVATQALNEGIAAGLSTDKYTNNLLRYAEKSVWMHKILTTVFADQPARLVRVVSSQNDNSFTARQILKFRDTAQWVDALATAPYFGHGFFNGANAGVTDLFTLFVALEAQRANVIVKAKENKAAADQYGLRYIAYEGGQHIVPPAANAETAAQMQRSPLMYDIYKRFLADWKTTFNDTMTLYSATGSISQYGAWGIREYAGQPLADTPKRRAAMEFSRQPL